MSPSPPVCLYRLNRPLIRMTATTTSTARTWLPRLAVLMATCTGLMACGGSAAAGGASEAGTPAVVPAPGAPAQPIPANFILGADVSSLDEVERLGGRFITADGRSGTALQILRASGIGWTRLRLWHTPVNDADVFEGNRLVSRRGDPVGGGNNDLAVTIRLAQRARAQGMKVLLDIHYSDFWVDPGQQTKPAAWTKLQGAELGRAVRSYTEDVLRRMHEAGCDPDMVQVGNEVNGGMLWPDGKTWQEKPGEVIGGDAGFVAMLREGIAGVRATDALRGGQRLPVMLHLAKGGDNELFRRVFDLFTREQLDYDVIGLSWYPYFHGPMSGLRANLNDLSSRYYKPLIVVETAYGFTLDNGDAGANIFNDEAAKLSGYAATPEGQAQLLTDLIRTVAAVPNGAGVMYWEPAWLPVAGSGWRNGDGNSWDNQALFDFKGRALPSLNVFKQVRQAATAR
ncbi:MAG: galactosidase [Burkholderiales bacterium PBB6]|nr:MAG: galactosidase [Burkholderiales bacterium PBB6]